MNCMMPEFRINLVVFSAFCKFQKKVHRHLMVFNNFQNQGAGKRPRQCCPKGPQAYDTTTRGPEGPESGQNTRVRGPEGPEDEQS